MLFKPAAKLEDLPPGAMLGVDVDDLPVLLVNVGGAVYALKNRCSHMNAPLSMGKLEGSVIECPLHRAKFDVTTGKCVSPPQMGGLQSVFVAQLALDASPKISPPLTLKCIRPRSNKGIS